MRIVTFLMGFLLPVAHAVTLDDAGTGAPGVGDMWGKICPLFLGGCNMTPGDAVTYFTERIMLFVGSLIGAVAVGMVIYAGIKMILSQGQDEGRTEAKKIILYALAGVVLMMIAAAVIGFFELQAWLWLD